VCYSNLIDGSIQKIYFRDTNLLVIFEDKTYNIPVQKDIILSASGEGNMGISNKVLGTPQAYAGHYGISKNPESFVVDGNVCYFTDKNRGKVMRLSRDGLTEISQYGMNDFFRDQSELINDNFKKYIVSTTSSTASGSTTSLVVTAVNLSNLELGMTAIVAGLTTDAYIVNLDSSTNTITLSRSITIPTSNPQKTEIKFFKYVKDAIEGAWDVRNRQYTISYKQGPVDISFEENFTFLNEPFNIENTSTLSFDESVSGWTSYYTYRPNIIFSSKNNFYSFKNSKLWKHYEEAVINNRGVFYNNYNESSIVFVINQNPSIKKVFQTVNYEGDNGFQVNFIRSDFQRVDEIAGIVPQVYGQESQDTTPIVYSYDKGLYTDTLTGQVYRAGFDRKENLYVANLINNSIARPCEVMFGSSMSGIKGYFATVKISTYNYTDVGGLKELWSVGSKFVQSS